MNLPPVAATIGAALIVGADDGDLGGFVTTWVGGSSGGDGNEGGGDQELLNVITINFKPIFDPYVFNPFKIPKD